MITQSLTAVTTPALDQEPAYLVPENCTLWPTSLVPSAHPPGTTVLPAASELQVFRVHTKVRMGSVSLCVWWI